MAGIDTNEDQEPIQERIDVLIERLKAEVAALETEDQTPEIAQEIVALRKEIVRKERIWCMNLIYMS